MQKRPLSVSVLYHSNWHDVGLHETFIDLLNAWLKQNGAMPHTTGRAINIREDEGLCDVERDDAPTLFDVRLNAIEDTVSNKVTAVPSNNSYVIIGLMDARHEDNTADAFIAQCSEIEKFFIKVGEKRYEISEDGFVIDSGTDSLKQTLIEIIEAVEHIIVLKGRNPDRLKLAQAKLRVNQIFK